MKKEITEEQKTRLANFNFDGPQWKTLTEIGATTSDVPFLRSMKGRGLVDFRPAWDAYLVPEWCLTSIGELLLFGGPNKEPKP